MFGLRFIKVEPTDYVLQIKSGKTVKEGTGLSFFYFGPTSSLVRIPVNSTDVPFMFQEVTSDFQEVTVQGQLTFRVSEPQKLAKLMNFTLAPNGKAYVSEDPKKLSQRLVQQAQVLTKGCLKDLPLREALIESDSMVTKIRNGLAESESIRSLGLEILGLSILAIKPTPETARALEAEAREQILKEADEAIYARRNASVEQERAIKENELNTEIAVENKQREIKETQMEAEKSIQHKKWEIRQAEMNAQIDLENRNQELVKLASDNARTEADAKAYGISAAMKAVSEVDHRTLQALSSVGMDPSQLVASAFRELAEQAEKVGQLNISPDLLRELMKK